MDRKICLSGFLAVAMIFIFTVCGCGSHGDDVYTGDDDSDRYSHVNPSGQFQCDATPAAHAAQNSPHQPKIIGGGPASINDWPWIAALVMSGAEPEAGQFCGGTLIDDEWVVTAAHCAGFGNIDVVLGTDNLQDDAGRYDRIAVDQIIIHPSYSYWSLENDIALLHLSEPSTQPVADIDRTSLAQPGTMGVVAGWGVTNLDNFAASSELLQVAVPVVSEDVCNEALGEYEGAITSGMFCAAYSEGGKDSCFGDSGGPFIIDGMLAGIVSWGTNLCAEPDEYGVYTRVSNYVSWMTSVICGD